MKRETKLHMLVAAIVAMSPLAVAGADTDTQRYDRRLTTGAINPLHEELNFISTASTGYFQRFAAMPKSGADELAMRQSGPLALADKRLQEEVNFISLGSEGHFQELARMPRTDVAMLSYDPRTGAYGPVRGDFNPQATLARASQERIWDNMYPIGASNTP